jgi:predicted nucleic acid-binding protein
VAFIVIYDACVLYPESMRDLLVRLGQTDLVQAKWTDEILDEFVENLAEKRPELKDRLKKTRELMKEAVRDCLVTGYQKLIDGLTLPDPDDRHVLAAAIRAGAQVIVTYN